MAPVLVCSPYNSPKDWMVLLGSQQRAIKKADAWIKLASSLNIQWWSTSALESNIGLNAISQWVFNKEPLLPQGLGTGMLFSNNIESPYFIENGFLKYNSDMAWNSNLFKDSIKTKESTNHYSITYFKQFYCFLHSSPIHV